MEFPTGFSLWTSYIQPPLFPSAFPHFLLPESWWFLQSTASYFSLAMQSFGLNLAVSILNTGRKQCPWQNHYLPGKSFGKGIVNRSILLLTYKRIVIKRPGNFSSQQKKKPNTFFVFFTGKSSSCKQSWRIELACFLWVFGSMPSGSRRSSFGVFLLPVRL